MMRKSMHWLPALCIAAIAGVFLLQFFWIRNYYYVNKATFEKEVNLTFEDAVTKEFEVRCDTIEQNLFKLLSDTNQFKLSNRYNDARRTFFLHINDQTNKRDNFYFHTDSVNEAINDSSRFSKKNWLAKYLAHQIRSSDVHDHMAFYRTQKLGEFINAQEGKYDFDTVRLRPIFKNMLANRGINVPFTFYARSKDSSYNNSAFNAKITAKYPVITKAFLTYKPDKNQHYIRAMFNNPLPYIIAQMGLLFAASLTLVLLFAFSLFYLLHSLLTEKKLALIKNDFISNITHELKTPIATVSAAVESLSDFDVLDDSVKTKRYLEHAKNELQRLSGLVNTILTSTLYENAAFECNYQRLNVDEMINKTVEAYKFNNNKRITIFYQNNTGIESLEADKMLFNQAIENIMDNAVKYSGNEVQININCVNENGFFVIRITDNGPGIAKENLPFLFEKFYRVPVNAHKIKGHGLGLNFVKSIMERHNGWCRAESRPGIGTTLILAWPI